MVTEKPQDEWSSGDAYEAYVGRWSRLVAREFLGWLDACPGLRWLDIGCGTGALSAAIVADADPAEVLGMDASLAYVQDAQRRLDDPRVRFETADAASLDIDHSFDVAVSGLVLNFLPDPVAAVAAMGRAVADGGVVAAYVWDYAHRMELVSASRYATRHSSRICGTKRGSGPSRPLPSTWRRCSRTSTITGHRSSVARDRRPGTRCLDHRSSGTLCGRRSVPPCPSPRTDRSR